MYELIQHQRLESPATSITFSGIPQTWTDLLIVLSVRSTDTATTFNGGYDPFLYRLNSTTTGYSSRALNGVGNAVDTDSDSTRTSNIAGGTWGRMGQWGINNANQTSNTFSSVQIYIPNYTSSTSKTISTDYVTENNATNSFQSISTQLWSNSAAISTIAFALGVGTFAAGSSASLYGINRTSAIGKPKAVGGNITYSNGYWVHTFTGSGTFSPREDLTCDYLVVAGGGCGGSAYWGAGSGGGAGGLRSTVSATGGGAALEAPLRVLAGSSHAVIVGAGGAPVSSTTIPNSGSNSSFASIIALGGGGGGSSNTSYPGLSGGSGGGSYLSSGGSGTSGQGFAGGYGGVSGSGSSGAGGGGAGQAGSNSNISAKGHGGSGVQVAIAGISTPYAGGGGGGRYLYEAGGPGDGGLGGGGAGSILGNTGTSGTANTGGGGGGGGSVNGGFATGGSGGSGIVIIRYPA